MKKLKVKNYDMTFLGLDESPTNTTHLIEYCLNLIPPGSQGDPGGFRPIDLKNAMRIQKVLDKAREELKKSPEKTIFIHLEDSDARNLKIIVERSRWSSRSPDILDFINEIDAL